MRITTDKGKTYTAQWAAVVTAGQLFAQLDDARLLSVIASEFEGLEWLMVDEKNEETRLYDGFGVLHGIQRTEPGRVQIILDREVVA